MAFSNHHPQRDRIKHILMVFLFPRSILREKDP
jgi:hypothetical protein